MCVIVPKELLAEEDMGMIDSDSDDSDPVQAEANVCIFVLVF